MTPTSRSNVSIDKRQVALGHLLSKANRNNHLHYGAFEEVVAKTGVHRNTLRTIWTRHCNGEDICNRRGQGGSKKGDKTKEIISNKLTKIDVHKRGTISSLAQNLQIGNKTTYRALRKGLIKKVITHVKPSLNTKQKIERLDFCIKHIDLPCFQFFLSIIPFILMKNGFTYKKQTKNVSGSGRKHTSKEMSKQEIYEKGNVPRGCRKATKELQNKEII